jgi:hypothetical protein
MLQARPGQLRVPGPSTRVLLPSLALGLLAAGLPAQEAGAGEGASEPVRAADAGSWELSGRLDAFFRHRRQEREGERDTDSVVTGMLDGAYRDADGREQFRFLFDGVLTADLDGLESSHEAFAGLGDARNSRTHAYVYQAWAETASLGEGLTLRAGRQEIHREDALYFDGVRLDAANSGALTAVVYAGSPVRFYESDRTGDFLGGVGLKWRASRELRLGLDEVFLRDRAPAGDRDRVINNNLTLVTAHWYKDEYTVVRGSSSFIGSDPRRQQLAVLWTDPAAGWWTRFHLQHQTDYGDVVVTELSPFAAVISEVAPYWTGTFELHRDLGGGVDGGLGYSRRWLDNEDDEGPYDREFSRWYALLTVEDFLVEHLEAGTRGDYWDADESRLFAGGFFLAWDQDADSRFEVGSDFAKYRFDVYSGREYLDDRQFYFRLRHRLDEQWSLRFRAARSRSQFGTDTTLEGAVALEF